VVLLVLDVTELALEAGAPPVEALLVEAPLVAAPAVVAVLLDEEAPPDAGVELLCMDVWVVVEVEDPPGTATTVGEPDVAGGLLMIV
jgi:hypothetical protein